MQILSRICTKLLLFYKLNAQYDMQPCIPFMKLRWWFYDQHLKSYIKERHNHFSVLESDIGIKTKRK